MNPKTIKLIDKWIGQPVCIVLTLIRYKTSIFPRKNIVPQKILFLKLIEQGATVLAYAAIEKAVKMVGKENVFFCVFKENRPILDIIGIIPVENVMEIRQKNLFTFIADVARFFIRTRKEKIDTTIDMEFFSRASAILAYMSGARNRVGLHRFTSEYPYRGDLMTHRIQYNPYLHTAHAYLLLVEALSRDNRIKPMLKIIPDKNISLPKFNPSETERENITALLKEKLGRDFTRPLVLLNPNAGDMLPLRKWPTEHFVELAKKLLSHYSNITIVITGAPSEKNEADLVRKEIDNPNVVCVAGDTSLRDVLTLYTIAGLLVTNDSGPGHFSSMTDIKTIVMFGPETPELFGPLGENAHVIWKKLACSPCVNAFNHRFSPCNDNVCMQSISVEEVFEWVKKLLP